MMVSAGVRRIFEPDGVNREDANRNMTRRN